MLAVERRKIILDYVNEKGIATVAQLSKTLAVTEETIRRDLQKLEIGNQLIRTHGGAVNIENAVPELAADIRQKINIEGKVAIAKKAVENVEIGDIIFLDASTTAYFLARELKDFEGISVITNSHKAINELITSSGVNLITVGGSFQPKNRSYVGKIAELTVRNNYCATKFFMSCKGLSSGGKLVEGNVFEAEIKQAMQDCSEKLFLMMDHSKFGIIGSYVVSSIDSVDYLITDGCPEGKWQKVLGDIPVIY